MNEQIDLRLYRTITLGVQSSGDDDRTAKHILELRRSLATHCKGPYSEEISEFALVLRIGGNMQEFDFEGCERIRRNRKDKYITVDLGFPSRRWRVTVRNPANGKIVTTLTTEAADTLVFSPDGRWLAGDPGVFPSPSSSLVVWDTKTWAVAATVKPERNPHQGAPVQWIAFGGGETEQRKLGYAQSLKFTGDGKTQTVWYSVYPLAVSLDGKLLVEPGQQLLSNVEVWDAITGQKLQTFAAHKMVTNSLVFSRDGRWLLTTGQESLKIPVDLHTFTGTTEYRVKVWDVSTWKERASVSYPQVLTLSGVLSPDGKRIAVERSWGVIDLLDVESGTSAGSLAAVIAPSNYGPIFGKGNLAFSASGSLLFEGAFKSGIYAWKLPVH